jgi:hypothetical protein
MKYFRHPLALVPLLGLGLLLSLSTPNYFSAMRARGAALPSPSQANRAEPDERLIIGVLEHNNSEERKGHNVRVAFFKEGGQWKPYPTNFNTVEELSQAVKSFPAEVAWTICFDGKSAGSLTSKNPESILFYKDVGIHQVSSDGTVPTVGRPSEVFSGWPGGQTYRPLVLNSRVNCADPAGWRPAKIEAGEVDAVKDYLRREQRVSAAALSKARVTPNKSYGSQTRGAKLLSLTIKGAEVIKGSGEDDQNVDAWFYVAGKEVRYLGSNMLLVDAGDYDGDGKEEAVFKVQRYNHDGYVLFHDGFKQKLEFGWGYH